MRRVLALIACLALAACGRNGPTALAPHQIHIAGSIAAYPFSTAVAERLMREKPDLIAPLVRAGGSGDGIARFCDGLGVRHPDIVIATRAVTAPEVARCRQNGIAHVAQVTIGRTAFLAVAGGPIPGLSRADLYRALTGSATRWSAIDPALPDAPIRIHGPAPDPGIADGLYDALLGPGCMAAKGQDCAHIRIRTDGAYIGHGANAELVAAAVAATPGAIGLLPYAQAMAHRPGLTALPLDGVEPSAQAIAAGRYPATAPLILLAKTNEAPTVPGLPLLLSYYARGLSPGGDFAARGLIAPERPTVAAQMLDTIGKADARL